MSDSRFGTPPAVVPVLTEVLTPWPGEGQTVPQAFPGAAVVPMPAAPVGAPAAEAPLGSPAAALPVVQAAAAVPPEPFTDAEVERITARVLAEVQRHVDQMLEYRLRDTLRPHLERATQAMLSAARDELAATLRDVAARAVAQEAARMRARGAGPGPER